MRAPLDRSPLAAACYAVIAVGMTWPVARGLTRDLPGDLGDPAFVAGMMAWGGEQWLALFSGDLAAVSRFWDAPFFAPESLVTSYSDHFLLHSLVTVPLYALTRNPILCYNVCFLGTFVLGGLGVYRLVRDLTGHAGAAFVAGLAFAFAPYRVATLAHLQVLSSVGMPWVLLGLRQYLISGHSDGLRLAGIALWAQNVASSYYMVFFAPFIALYALAEMWARGLLRRAAVWRDLTITALVVAAALLPFLMPYLMRRNTLRRATTEIVAFSADLMSWFTASPLLRLWGGLQAFPKIEGQLFPGVTVVLLGLGGLGVAWWKTERRRSLRRNESQAFDASSARAIAVFGTLALVLSVWLSFGPQVQLETHTLPVPSLYQFAVDYVPGFASARVPSRFAMITVLTLSLLAGVSLSRLPERLRSPGLALAGLLLLAEGLAAPLPINRVWSSAPETFRPPEARLYPLAKAPPVYRALAALDRAVVAHFPFGLIEREIQYGYYATLHGHRIVNGYSGRFPTSYTIRQPVLGRPLDDPTATSAMLDLDEVTHLVIHTDAWLGDGGQVFLEWLVLNRSGWRVVERFGADYLLERN